MGRARYSATLAFFDENVCVAVPAVCDQPRVLVGHSRLCDFCTVRRQHFRAIIEVPFEAPSTFVQPSVVRRRLWMKRTCKGCLRVKFVKSDLN